MNNLTHGPRIGSCTKMGDVGRLDKPRLVAKDLQEVEDFGKFGGNVLQP